MRLATTHVVAAALLATAALPAVVYCQAGTPPIDAFGLECTALGQAQLDYDPVARRLPIRNIGSSGQDGVDIKLGRAVAGVVMQWDTPPDLGPGGSYAFEMRGVSGGVGALTQVGMTSHQNQDGSRDLTPNFSGVGATECWVILLNGERQVVKRVHKPLQFTVRVSSSIPIAEMTTSCGIGMGKGLYEWMRTSYTHEVLVSNPGAPVATGVACTDIVFACTTGDPMMEMSGAQLRLNGLPPGEPVIGTLGVVPPCAGCPNGPEELDYVVNRGNAKWIVDAAPPQVLAVDNLGSSGQDGVAYSPGCPKPICPRESPTLPHLGMVIDEQPIAPGTLTAEARGVFATNGAYTRARLHCFVNSFSTDFEPDFSEAGATGYRVKLYSGGVLVAEEVNPLSRVSHQKPQTQWLVQADQIGGSGPMEFRIICITSPCPGWSVTMNGALYMVDEIVFQPEGSDLASPSTMLDLAMTVATSSGPGNTSSTAYLPVYGVSGTNSPLVGVPVLEPAIAAGARLSPNPASGPVSVVFAMPRGGRADVAVIDAAGRHVRSLAARTFTAGAHSLVWDGRDDGGHATAPGVYFVRVASAGTARSSQVTRLR